MMPSSYTIEYQICKDREREILKIWEVVPNSVGSKQPWLYQMNYELSGDTSAHLIINYVLEAAGATQLTSYQFTRLNGKIKVMPNPTLRLFRS